MQDLNSYTCPLNGRNVVSAGAGTGKTYNIQILVLRKILQGTPIQSILVVTFTNLATDELQERLRQILQTAMTVCEALIDSGGKVNDSVMTIGKYEQVLPCLKPQEDLAEAEAIRQLEDKRNLLRTALQDFDSAPISTIHGFCSRMLKEHAFESNMRYGMEIRKTNKALLKSLLCDFYRDFCKGFPATSRRLILLNNIELTPDVLQNMLKPVFSNPDVNVNWGADVPLDSDKRHAVIAQIEQSAAWDRLPEALNKLSEDEKDLLCKQIKKAFCSYIYHFWDIKKVNFCCEQGMYAIMTYYPSHDDLKNYNNASLAASPSNLPTGRFSFETHASKVQEAKDLANSSAALRAYLEIFDILPADSHHVQDLPQDDIAQGKSLYSMLDLYKRLIACEATEAIQKGIKEAKLRDGFLTYNDLLLELNNCLKDPQNGPALRQVIRDRYQCVMIDEFQDTDSTQDAIFSTLFSDPQNDDAAKDDTRALFMIGDEKQAIYKFRGGDVQTFQAEQFSVPEDRRYTLTKNFRSTGDFVSSMNDFWNEDMRRVFFNPNSSDANSTLVNNIHMPEIVSGAKGNEHVVTKSGHECVQGADLLKLEVTDNVYNEVAHVVEDYVQKYQFCTIEEKDGKKTATVRDIHYGDIAILLRAKTDIDKYRDALRDNGIASVYMQGQSAFKAEESKWLQMLMDAILQPGNQAKAMLLLGSKLFGLSPLLLDIFRYECLPDFQMTLKDLNDKWQNISFFVMANKFFGMKLSEMMPKLPLLNKAMKLIVDTDGSYRTSLPEAIRPLVTATAEQLAANYRYAADESQNMSVWQNLQSELEALITPDDTCLLSRVMTVAEDGERSLSMLQQIIEKLMDVATEQHLGQMGLFTFLSDKIQKTSSNNKDDNQQVDEEDDDDEVYPAHLTTQNDAVKFLTIHKSKGLQFRIVLVPALCKTSEGWIKQRETIFHVNNERMVNLDESDKQKQKSCDDEAAAEMRRLMYVAITRAIYACRFLQKDIKDDGKLGKPVWFLQNPKLVIGEKNAQENNLDYDYYGKYVIAPETVEADDWLCDEATQTSEEPAPIVSNFNLRSGELYPGWVTTSFSEISRVPKAKSDDDDSDDKSDGDNDEGDSNNDNGMQPSESLVPYDERTPLFQFPGGKRTGVCWHEIFENLDFTLWQDSADEALKLKALDDVQQRLDHYGQLGRATSELRKQKREQRLDAFTTMLQKVMTCPLQFGDDPVLRLCDIPSASTLREMKFTYHMKADMAGDELRQLLEKEGIMPPDNWSHGLNHHQKLTGAIDLLFQNPANGKFYIVDWKTNILEGCAESFTPEGVKAEIDKRFYSLQCVMYTLVFIQYYRQVMHGKDLSGDDLAEKLVKYGREAYDKFGGCADIFVRGVDGTTNHGAHVLVPSYELISALDAKIGVVY